MAQEHTPARLILVDVFGQEVACVADAQGVSVFPRKRFAPSPRELVALYNERAELVAAMEDLVMAVHETEREWGKAINVRVHCSANDARAVLARARAE